MKPAKIAVALLLGILFVSGLACAGSGTSSEPTPTLTPTTTATVNENTGSFEIYLAVNSSAYDFRDNCSDVGNVALSDEPIVSTEDISSYNWSSHYIELTEEGCSQFIERLQESGWIYTPFVVVANGEPIYKGVFYSSASSFSEPYCPCVFDAGLVSCDYTNGHEGFVILPAGWLIPISVNGTRTIEPIESDVRSDNRIYQALEQAGKLIE